MATMTNAIWMGMAEGGAALSAFGLVLFLCGGREAHGILRKGALLGGMLRDSARESSWYEGCRAWLLKNGAGYHYSSRITPEGLLTASVLLAALGFGLAGASGQVLLGIPAGLLLGALPYLLLPVLNRADNEKMLPEIRMIYHALAMQIRSGVYVTDALAECYSAVENDRLRDALLALAGDLVMKSDLFDALDRFQRKFDNPYIDSLCITVLSAMESGRAVELLGDISEQVKDMEQAVLGRRKAALDRSTTFYQLGILSAVLGVAIYACVEYMLTSVSAF